MPQRIVLNAIGSDDEISVDGERQRARIRPSDEDGAVEITVPDGADTDERAAIAAAVRTYLADERPDPEWGDRRWQLSTRLAPGPRVRVPPTAPPDPWVVAARTGHRR